jgi:hypothetical protein
MIGNSVTNPDRLKGILQEAPLTIYYNIWRSCKKVKDLRIEAELAML